MKKQLLKSALVAVAGIGLMCSAASAKVFEFEDTWIDWPGFDSGYPFDVYGGDPLVESFMVDVDMFSGTINWVTIQFDTSYYSRTTFDTLFINASYDEMDAASWDKWDYIIRDEDDGSRFGSIADGAYMVNDPLAYDYQLTEVGDGAVRPNTPIGIDSSDLTPFNLSYTITEDTANKTMTYTFQDGLMVNGGFFIAYSPWCGNDVIGGGAPVPEPTGMLLYGVSMLGLAAVARRRKNS